MNSSEMWTALAKAQSEFEEPKRSKQGYGYKYAPLEEIRRAIMPALIKNNLVIIQPVVSENDYVGVETVLSHISGTNIRSRFLSKPLKGDPQSIGSLITYYRRYALLGILGLAPEDDDGVSAMPKQETQPSPQQVTESSNEVDPGAYVLGFGKFKGQPLKDIAADKLESYSKWLAINGKNDLASETVDKINLYLMDTR